MTGDLPHRVPQANLPRWCPPPPGGWFATRTGGRVAGRGVDRGAPQDIPWPVVDLDPESPRALLRDSELPDDVGERTALLVRVRDGIQRIPRLPRADSGGTPAPAGLSGSPHLRLEDEP